MQKLARPDPAVAAWLPRTRLRQVAEFSEDFQQYLADQVSERLGLELPNSVRVFRRPLRVYRGQVHMQLETWEPRDWGGMLDFLFIEDPWSVPPLIVQGDELLDGYHRVTAMYLAGVTHWEVVNLVRGKAGSFGRCLPARETACRSF